MTTDTAGPIETLGLADMPAPGGFRAALNRADAPGAPLNGEEWARTWGAFLGAISDPWNHEPRQMIKNVMSERVPDEGGFLVPEQLRSQVLSYVAPAIVRPKAMVLPMGSERLAVPTLDNPSQAAGTQALGGMKFAVTAPGAPITSSTPAFGRTVLEARKPAGLIAVPDELVNDGAGAFGDFLSRVVAAGYAWFEDDLFIGANGGGTAEPQGVINAPAAVRIARTTSGSAPVLADIAKMADALHPASLAAGLTPGITDVMWLVSASAFTALLQLYLAVGTAPTGADVSPGEWLQLGDGHGVGPSMLGLPLAVTDHQPAVGSPGDIALADLRHYLIGDRMSMTIERSDAGPSFPLDSSLYRVRARVDGRYWIQSPSTTEAGQAVSPVVVLA